MPDKNPSHEAFLRVFLRNEDDLKGYARALMPNWHAVGEVMQEASVVMLRKWDQLQHESEFLPWAKVIVRLEVMKTRQSSARDRLRFSDDVFELLAQDDPNDEAEDMAQRERIALDRCLDEFQPVQRELLFVPYHGHGAVTQLAAESGKTVNSLYKKIARLRLRLTQCVTHRLADSTLGEPLS
ncbi:RNA polymerase sigma factor [Rubripirellula lacrimiformis]|uniref:RNA polymerase sigma factor n=1 Tax=Rubripirellula lacrimiformis TaxID=1930273 RepID=A0A517ND68_9BACT|nr:sigma factor [Rubripirellula lacrimiformis]QDT05008.1 RNA polymerase sigma factor [Rubripirellula lacrimiformis]